MSQNKDFFNLKGYNNTNTYNFNVQKKTYFFQEDHQLFSQLWALCPHKYEDQLKLTDIAKAGLRLVKGRSLVYSAYELYTLIYNKWALYFKWIILNIILRERQHYCRMRAARLPTVRGVRPLRGVWPWIGSMVLKWVRPGGGGKVTWSPLVDRQTHLWKHYLHATSFVDSNKNYIERLLLLKVIQIPFHL